MQLLCYNQNYDAIIVFPGLRFQKENITTQYGGGTEDPVKPSVGNTSLGKCFYISAFF